MNKRSKLLIFVLLLFCALYICGQFVLGKIYYANEYNQYSLRPYSSRAAGFSLTSDAAQNVDAGSFYSAMSDMAADTRAIVYQNYTKTWDGAVIVAASARQLKSVYGISQNIFDGTRRVFTQGEARDVDGFSHESFEPAVTTEFMKKLTLYCYGGGALSGNSDEPFIIDAPTRGKVAAFKAAMNEYAAENGLTLLWYQPDRYNTLAANGGNAIIGAMGALFLAIVASGAAYAVSVFADYRRDYTIALLVIGFQRPAVLRRVFGEVFILSAAAYGISFLSAFAGPLPPISQSAAVFLIINSLLLVLCALLVSRAGSRLTGLIGRK